jgi:MFS transporter, DHA2 family, glioxin efflux transporter
LTAAVAQNNTTLIVGRAIQGVGASGLQNGTYTIVGVVLPPQQRPMFTGILGIMFGITCVIGPLLGGVFTENLTWRWCFYINLPLGGAVALTLLISMKPPKNTARAAMTWKELVAQLDPLGVALLVSATLCALLALQWGGIEHPWDSSVVIGLIVGFVLIFAAFVIDQWFMKERASYPFRIVRKRNVAVSIVWNFLYRLNWMF